MRTLKLLLALFVGTKLRDTLKKMTLSKFVPEDLKPQESEHESCYDKPPIPCIPEKDELQEAVKTGASRVKFMFPYKVE